MAEKGFLLSWLGNSQRCQIDLCPLTPFLLALSFLHSWMTRIVPRVPLTQRWWRWRIQGDGMGSDILKHEGKWISCFLFLEEGGKRRGAMEGECSASCPAQEAMKVPQQPCASELHSSPQTWSNTSWRRASFTGSSWGPADFSVRMVFKSKRRTQEDYFFCFLILKEWEVQFMFCGVFLKIKIIHKRYDLTFVCIFKIEQQGWEHIFS